MVMMVIEVMDVGHRCGDGFVLAAAVDAEMLSVIMLVIVVVVFAVEPRIVQAVRVKRVRGGRRTAGRRRGATRRQCGTFALFERRSAGHRFNVLLATASITSSAGASLTAVRARRNTPMDTMEYAAAAALLDDDDELAAIVVVVVVVIARGVLSLGGVGGNVDIG